MGATPRITNRERVLLALEDSPQFADQYEIPRRFSQVGLAHRLGMAQSHVSRALSSLLKEGLLLQKRNRVVGERRRVTTYSMSDEGLDSVRDLISEIEHSTVLTTAEDGTLEQVELSHLVERWARKGGKRFPDALSMADLLRESELYDGLPRLESPPDVQIDTPEEDLSSEAIGLHLELAELRRSQGDINAVIDHLGRAANLHFKRGNASGQVRCLLAAASLGAPVTNPQSMIDVVSAIHDPVEKFDSQLMLYDVLASQSNSAAGQVLLSLSNEHPQVQLRLGQVRLRTGEAVNFDDLPEELPGASPLRQSLWLASLLRLKCQFAGRDGSGWPIPSRVEATLSEIGADSRHPHPQLFGELVLSHIVNPVIDNDAKTGMLQSAWEMQPSLPTAGHIGFQLSDFVSKAESMMILIRLQQLFTAAGDLQGADICGKKLDAL